MCLHTLQSFNASFVLQFFADQRVNLQFGLGNLFLSEYV